MWISLNELVRRVWERLRSARAAFLAAGLSYYLLAGLLPVLVLAAGILGVVSDRNDNVADEVIRWLGIEGNAARIVSESIAHAERVRVTSSLVGVAGLLWAALAVTGALRRVVDAVWGVADVGWTARFRSAPWAAVAAALVVLTSTGTGLTATVGGVGSALGGLVGVASTAALSVWFLARLGTRRPTGRALGIAAVVLTLGLEATKNGAVIAVPRLASRESALYGGLGSALAALVGLLVISWLLLFATAVAAELTLAQPLEETDGPNET